MLTYYFSPKRQQIFCELGLPVIRGRFVESGMGDVVGCAWVKGLCCNLITDQIPRFMIHSVQLH